MKILFINSNSEKPHCAVFQAGEIYADAMRLCKEFDLDYLAVPGDINDPIDFDSYDAVIFNYQHISSAIIAPEVFSYCKVAIGFLYEARSEPSDSPMHFGDLMAGQLFDILISPDPTLVSTSKVWGVPRVIPRSQPIPKIRQNKEVWISTFGFPSPWKNLKGIVEMMNEEFESAVFRLNFAMADHQDGTPLHERQMWAAKELRDIAKPGIGISVSQHYMEDRDLVNWLAQSDLNVFLSYPERGIQTGGALLASADMAISAQRPLLVSDNIEARHLPGLRGATLTAAMHPAVQNEVTRLYNYWSPENFAAKMDELVRENLK